MLLHIMYVELPYLAKIIARFGGGNFPENFFLFISDSYRYIDIPTAYFSSVLCSSCVLRSFHLHQFIPLSCISLFGFRLHVFLGLPLL